MLGGWWPWDVLALAVHGWTLINERKSLSVSNKPPLKNESFVVLSPMFPHHFGEMGIRK
jgi:hypothetical protein